MSKIIISFLLLFTVSGYAQTNCTPFDINQFVLNGAASLSGTNEVTLTPAQGDLFGTMWSSKKILFDKDFTIESELYFGSNDGGADGIAFVLQPLSSNAGGAGGGMGYFGIKPSLTIEFDTWYNSGSDPITNDHIAIIKNGLPYNLSAHSEYISPIDVGNIEDGLWHSAKFEWNASNKMLKLIFDGNIMFNINVDLKVVFPDMNSVYWGFTSATGAANNLQKVKLKNYCVTFDNTLVASNTDICIGTPVTLTANSSTTQTTSTTCKLPSNFQTNLVGYWPFCENANDVSGLSNNGTVNGAVLTTDRFGNTNSSYIVKDSFIRTQNHSNLTPNTFTYSFWVFANTAHILPQEGIEQNSFMGVGTNNCVIHPNHGSCYGDAYTNAGSGIFVGTNGIFIVEHSHNYVKVALSKAINLIGWNLITIVYQNKLPQLFVNGLYISSGQIGNRNIYASTGFDNTTFADYSKSGFGAGLNGKDDNGYKFDGKIDDIGIWNRALTSSEIQQLFNLNQTTYLWSTGEKTLSIIVSPSVTTSYWCDITFDNKTIRKEITITVNPLVLPIFTQISPICNGSSIANLTTISNNGIQGTWTPSLNNIVTTSYTFTPKAGQCAATATMSIKVNQITLPPTGTSIQTFCNLATVANLTATGTAIKWYAAATGGTALTNSTSLINGTNYYASQTVNSCESATRLQVNAIVNTSPMPTANPIQLFCKETLLSDLQISGTAIQWYSNTSGGTPLPSNEVLVDGNTYYASQTLNSCESQDRAAVLSTIFNTNLTANQLITINGNTFNDRLKFYGLEQFPNNEVQIFNRYGKLVWSTVNYSNTSNYFDGMSNAKDVISKNNYLPTGTYFYVIRFDNSCDAKEMKGFMQIDNSN